MTFGVCLEIIAICHVEHVTGTLGREQTVQGGMKS
jgi:hypothetical protein